MAGEIKRPQTFSLRSLEIMRNLTCREAQLFERICRMRIVLNDVVFLPNNSKLLKQFGINYEDIMLLDECGLLNSSGIITYTVDRLQKQQAVLAHSNTILIMICAKDDDNHEIVFKEYPFTSVGKEIATLFTYMPTDEYLLEYARLLKSEATKADVFAYLITDESTNGIQYAPKDLLEISQEC